MRQCKPRKGTLCNQKSTESLTKPVVRLEAQRQHGLHRHVHGGHVDRHELFFLETMIDEGRPCNEQCVTKPPQTNKNNEVRRARRRNQLAPNMLVERRCATSMTGHTSSL